MEEVRMKETTEDGNLISFFEAVLKDKTEMDILKLILEGKERDSIIDELFQKENNEKPEICKQGKSQ